MTITMQNIERLTLAEMKDFVTGSSNLELSIKPSEAYGLIARILLAHGYRKLGRVNKGIVRLFLMKVTGMSRAQLTRLIGRWRRDRKIERLPIRRPNFVMGHALSRLRCHIHARRSITFFPSSQFIRWNVRAGAAQFVNLIVMGDTLNQRKAVWWRVCAGLA